MKMEIKILSEGEPVEVLEAIVTKLQAISKNISVSTEVIEHTERIPASNVIRPDFSSEAVRQASLNLKVAS